MIDSYLAPWFLKAVRSHDEVTDSEVVDEREVRIFRKNLSPITVVPVASQFLTPDDVTSVLAENLPTSVVLVNKTGHYAWTAREIAESHGSSVQTFGELYACLGQADPRGGVDKKVEFIFGRLQQHSRVARVEMVCEATIRINRTGRLASLLLAVEAHYEFTEEVLLRALARHPDVDIVYNGNPNGKITAAAHEHGGHAGVEVLGFRDLMSRIHEH